jgi:hypothetical protein
MPAAFLARSAQAESFYIFNGKGFVFAPFLIAASVVIV